MEESDLGQRAEGLVLAAGKSVRMGGSCKLSLSLDGEPMLVRALESLLPFCRRITIVTGAHARIIDDLLAVYAPTASEKGTQLDCVLHSGYERGMFSSLQAGIRHVLERTDACGAEPKAASPHAFSKRTPLRILFLPGDYPLVDPSVCERLLRKCAETSAEAAVPVYEGKPGHPVLFGSRVAQMIVSTPETGCLRDILSAWEPVSVPVDCPGILRDVDTLADWQDVTGRMKGGHQVG